MTQNGVSREAVLSALSKVQEPELHKDLVTLNMIQNLEISDSLVSFTIVLTTPACPLRGRIESEARQAVMSVPGVTRVDIKMDSNVPSDGRPRGVRACAGRVLGQRTTRRPATARAIVDD